MDLFREFDVSFSLLTFPRDSAYVRNLRLPMPLVDDELKKLAKAHLQRDAGAAPLEA
jgi:hypothetical protein